MPHTIPYRPHLIENLISCERLESYKTVFCTTTDIELIGAYLWSVHVSAQLYPLLSAVEVGLRNAIDSTLTADLGKFWWKKSKLHYKSFQANLPPPFVVKSVYENFDHAAQAVIKEKRSDTPSNITLRIMKLSRKQSFLLGNFYWIVNSWGII